MNTDIDVPWWRTNYDWQGAKDYLDLYRPHLDKVAAQEATEIVKYLRLERGKSILDLACGYGRHAIPLAKMGYKVMGIDASRHMLELARDTAREKQAQLDLKLMDMRELRGDGEYDLALCLFSSWGYFTSDEENADVLARVAKATRKDGAFVLEVRNPANTEGDVTVERPEFTCTAGTVWAPDHKGVVMTQAFVFPDGSERTYTHRVKVYQAEDLSLLLRRAGFSAVTMMSDFGGSHPGPFAPRLVAVAYK